VLLLAVMAVALPPAAIIPVHGMVQLGSNISRASMTLRHINLRLILWFAPGALLGAWLGSLFLVELPLALVQLCIAAFILLLCWGPPIPRIATSAPCGGGDHHLHQSVRGGHGAAGGRLRQAAAERRTLLHGCHLRCRHVPAACAQGDHLWCRRLRLRRLAGDRKSTRLNSSHVKTSYA